MSNQQLQKQAILNPDNILKSEFTLSLLQEALRTGQLEQHEVEKIQMNIMSELCSYTNKYTKGKSSSVREETAQSLMQSLLYTFDNYLMSFVDLEDSLNIVKSTNINALYGKGKELILTYIEQARHLYSMLKNAAFDVKIMAYHNTLKAVEEFFNNYDPEFAAHETPVSIDYPLLDDDMGLCGIAYIKQYLEKLYIENEFCNKFSSEFIDEILEGYGQLYQDDYRQMLVNVSQILLSNCIAIKLSGRHDLFSMISFEDATHILNCFSTYSSNDCLVVIQNAINQLLDELGITEPKKRVYFQIYAQTYTNGLFQAISDNTLEQFFIVKQQENITGLTFSDGKQMNDKTFRLVVNKLLVCHNAVQKSFVIKQFVYSLQDLIDIFDSDCIFDDEYTDIFNEMEDVQIIILVNKTFENLQLKEDKFQTNFELAEKTWHHFLFDYLKNMNTERQNNILLSSSELKRQI